MYTQSARRAVAIFSASLLLCACAGIDSGDAGVDNESGLHVVAAETALIEGNYLGAAAEYRKAAFATEDPATLRFAAEKAFEFGAAEDARATIRRWLELDPANADATLLLARLALRGHDADAALEPLMKYPQRSESVGEGLDQISRVLLAEGSDAVVLQLAQDISAAFPDVWQSQRLLSRVALRAGEKNLAMEAAESAFEIAPESFEAGLLQAQAIVVGGDTAAGLEFAAEIAGGAEGADQLLEYAAFLAGAGALEDAENVVADIRRAEPDSAEVLKAMAMLNMRAGNVDDAWKDLSTLALEPRHRHDALFYLGNLAERQQRTEQAIRLYSQVGDGENTVASQQRVSRILMRAGREEAAIDHLEEFSARQPDYGFRLLLPRAALLREAGQPDKALGIYDQVLEIRPHSEPVLLTRAETLLNDDRLDEAIAAYRYTVKLHPDSPIALNALGYTLTDRTREHTEAYQLIEKALALSPDSAPIIDSMGWVLFKQGKYSEALEHLERAWDLMKDPEVAAHLGETLWMLGEKEKAKAVLKEAFDRSPDSSPCVKPCSAC